MFGGWQGSKIASTPVSSLGGHSALETPAFANTLTTTSTTHMSTPKQHLTIGPGMNYATQARTTSSTSLTAGHQSRASGECDGTLYRAEVNVQERGRGEDKGRRLSVAVTSPSQANRRVSVVVTDPADHFFYYSVNLPEEDFPALRAHQGLLVDFLSFPGMLTQLVEKCVEEGRTVQPKFVLVLNCSGPQVSLDFTELSQFKHLVHLSLVVLKATDSQLKDYLVDSLVSVKREKEAVEGELREAAGNLQERLEGCQSQLEAKSCELEQWKSENRQQTTNLGQRLAKEVAEEKEKALAAVQEVQLKAEQERRDLDTKHMRSVQQLENRVASLDVQNRDLVEVRYKQEASLREARARVGGLEEEVVRLRQELGGARQEKAGLESCQGDKERMVSSLTTRLALLEQELADKSGLARQQEEIVRQKEEARERMARELEEKQRLVERREKAVKTVTEELMKANEIIGKLQAEVKTQQGKVRLRSSIAGEQEKLLGEKDKELGAIRSELEERRNNEEKLAKEVEDCQKREEEHRGKVVELEKLLETKENVMNWLNKQVDKGGGGPAAGKRVGRGGVNRLGVRSTKTTGGVSDHPAASGTVTQHLRDVVNMEKGLDNIQLGGLDAKYFERSTPGGTQWRSEIPRELPSNLRSARGGLLRKPTE